MSTVGKIRAALRANIKSSIRNLQVSPYVLASPTPPGVHVMPAEVRFDLAMGHGLDEYDFTIQAFVAHTSGEGNQSYLDELIDPGGTRSMKRAIESDRQLGGLATDLRVVSNNGYRLLVTQDNRALITSEWLVTVWLVS